MFTAGGGLTGEAADAILYLAGDSALSVTGFNLVLDRGMTM